MNMNDSFFDNIEVLNQNVTTYSKPQTICKSLERSFAICSNPPNKNIHQQSQSHKDVSIQRHQSYKLDYFLKQQVKNSQNNTQSKSFRSIKQQDYNTNNLTQNPQKSYLKQQMRLKINLENDAYQSNLRHKTSSSHNTTNPYQSSLATLMKQQMQKQQQSYANICKTLNDESKPRISSTHRQSIVPQKLTQRQDSVNIRKSNSVYMQEFRKMFSKSKYSMHNNI
ncbi:unnamed protein product (macronuclear) [Paramecium tetraurelia]|uniref:Uncharacterized protein n=1 Tax=Paramecium tetraurelia TaxID=5888 RepID=A0CRI9_PARTE|nr:uncharacterized protein GSPATT00009721001 [Paramecium tetraurelia]CAK73406.1 unnamed protein product [Paramecium tetraurelia]|eukprot:XP_001440803.1 hypothetical protein (macronuclear) [Paramecium tetraurelia strain d4-2]